MVDFSLKDKVAIITGASKGIGRAIALAYSGAGAKVTVSSRKLAGVTSVAEEIEAMGRNAGWLAAATALAKHSPEDAPHLIYVPERPLSAEKFLRDVSQVRQKCGFALVVVSETLRDEKGGRWGTVPDGVRHDAFGHPRVAGAVVTGVSDELRGEVVRAVISLKEGGAATEQEIRHFCLGRMANYKVPKQIVFVDSLPKTATGKIRKQDLRDYLSTLPR